MSEIGRHLKRIDEEEEYYLKYSVPYPLHTAAATGDTDALTFLSKRKHVNSCNEKGLTPLHVACQHGHSKTVAALLKLDADVNSPDRHTGRTPLHYACSNSNTTVVQLLLKNGAVPYDQDKHGVFPMHIASTCGLVDIIRCLVAAGGQVNCHDKVAETPLHYASKKDSPDTIETLVQCGGSLETKNKNEETALHVAATKGCVHNIRMLHQQGANLNSTNKHGETPLHIAVRARQIGSIEALSQVGTDLNARNDIKECAIHLAARLGHWKDVKHLLTAGVEIDIPYKKGTQAVHIAAQYGSCDVIHLLKKHGVDLNAEDKVGNRPLHYAVKAERSEVIRVLVELGADINAGGKRGDTPIHQATKDKQIKMVQVLGSVGADCNAVNDSALCPLFYAAVNEDLQTSKSLLHEGANVNMINSDGESLVHIMVEEERLEALTIMKTLKAKFDLLNKDGQTCVHLASKDAQTNVLRHLKDIGADLNMRNKYGLSVLHVAVIDNKGEEVDMLNNFGLDLNCQSKNFQRDEEEMPPLSKSHWPPEDVELEDYWKIKVGMTPVHMAFCYEHRDILAHLVSCGADINAENSAGETVFHMAVLFNKLDWLQPFITLGANRNCKDKFGRTPLHYAAHAGNMDGIRTLLKYGAIVSEGDFDERQPLHYAAESGHFLLLREFTGNNNAADINCRDKNGCTPLHFACNMGNIETIMELLVLKADVKATDKNDNTVLHTAAAGGQHEVIVLLAAHGCNMDIQNKDLKTPLHIAAEHGQAEAMEYLLMCGADPSIRDKSENLPSTYKLIPQDRQTISRLIKQFNDSRSLKHTAGEINYDCKMVSVDNKIAFKRLGINVTLNSSNNNVRPIIFIHRTPADSGHQAISLSALEEILSDVYELRVLCLNEECTLTIDIPLDGYPGNFDSYLKTTENEQFEQFTTSEENGVPTFVGKVPICKSTSMRFAVVARPAVHTHQIGSDGGTLMSELDRKVRLEIPKKSLEIGTYVSLQVIETGNIEKTHDRLFAANIVNIACDTRPNQHCQIQIPLHDATDGVDNVVLFLVHNEEDLDNERRWILLDVPLRQFNDCILFNMKTFGIYIPVNISDQNNLSIDTARHGAKERIKSVLLRETSALFFFALCPKKDSFLTILECTTPGRYQRRREFWENEGFYFHPQVKHSGHFASKPNQEFFFDVTGNIQFVGTSSKSLRLTFNPRAYKYQSFYLTIQDRKVPHVGEIQVFTKTFDKEVKRGARDVLVTSLPVELPMHSSCVIA